MRLSKLNLVRGLAALVIAAVAAWSATWGVARGDADPYLDLPVEPGQPWPVPPTPPPVMVATPPKPEPPPLPPTPTAPLPQAPPTFYGKDLPSKGNLVYVIDVSGSMEEWDGTGEPRLVRAKRALLASLASLPRSFTTNLYAFDCAVTSCWAALQPADDAHRTEASAWVGALKPNGATGTGPAVVLALQDPGTKLLVLLTDGDPNCGAGTGQPGPATMEAHLRMIRGANHGVEIDVFGVCAELACRDFCVRLAAQNGGTFTPVR